MSESLTKTTKNIHMSLKDIEISIANKMSQLLESQKCGNYVKADQLKTNIEQLKKQFNEKKLNEMIHNHKKEKKRLEKTNQQELALFDETWNKKIENFNCQKDKLKSQITQKHHQELNKAKIDLQTQVSNKLKESSECLNYRKIQQQMKKQKKYFQANQIQQKISELEVKEKQIFEKQRQLKIRTALKAIKNKQNTEIQALNKKSQTGLKELTKQKQKELQKLKLKHTNAMKDLLSQQQKQVLGEKGHIKSRVSLSMCRSSSKLMSVSKKRI